jgi:RimJ/RimL family protein N-acetyltransferase
LERPAEDVRKDRPAPLRTERLILRAPHKFDAGALAELINNRRIVENLARAPNPYTIDDAHDFIALVERGSEPAFLVTLPDGTLIGGCGIGSLRRDGPEIGYWLGVPFWGRGYATEAARAVIDHAFEDLGHDFLLGGARVTNSASRRVLEKCGYQWTGVVLQRVRALGTSVPCDRFRLTREQWESLPAFGTLKQMA